MPCGKPGPPTQRDRHQKMMRNRADWTGSQRWTMAGSGSLKRRWGPDGGRYRALIGQRLRARGSAAQQTEAGGPTPEIRPSPAGHHIEVRRLGPLAFYPPGISTRRRPATAVASCNTIAEDARSMVEVRDDYKAGERFVYIEIVDDVSIVRFPRLQLGNFAEALDLIRNLHAVPTPHPAPLPQGRGRFFGATGSNFVVRIQFLIASP